MKRPARALSVVLSVVLATVSLVPSVPSPAQAQANTWYVSNSGNDANACNTPAAPCATIQAAVDRAASGDTVRVAVGTYTGSGSEVILIDKSVTLSGGWDATAFSTQVGVSTIDGQLSRRGISIAGDFDLPAYSVTLTNFRIQNGYSIPQTDMYQAAGIRNYGDLTLDTVTISHNAQYGISSIGVGRLRLNNSSIHHNGAGGIYANTWVYVVNSTISDNQGAALRTSAGAHVRNATITGNAGSFTGGLSTNSYESTVKNSIVAGNSPNDIIGGMRSEGYNIVSVWLPAFAPLGTDVVTSVVKLAPLGNYGGLVETQPPQTTSPAINAGDPAGCRDVQNNLILLDARGASRLGRCDIGASEVQLSLDNIAQGDLRPGGLITYTILVQSEGADMGQTSAMLTNTLPVELEYLPGSLQVSSGSGSESQGIISWTGVVYTHTVTSISYRATVQPWAGWGAVITNTTLANWSGWLSYAAHQVQLQFAKTYLPVTIRNYCPDFFDDFSNSTSGWLNIDNRLGRFGYLNGEYQMLSRQAGYLFLVRAPACPRENYLVEADFRWNGNTGSDLGLIFGLQGDFDRFYYFVFNTDYQAFALYRFEPDHVVTLISPQQSGAIRPGNAINRARATRNGSQISLAMNGVAIGWTYDNAISGLGHAGLAMSPYDDVPVADARVDNFRFSSLPGLLQASAAPAALPALDHQPSAWTPNLDAVREGRK